MDDPSSKRLLPWSSALRVGSHTPQASFFLAALVTFITFAALPILSKWTGAGWSAALLLALFSFFGLLIFKNLIFRSMYKNAEGEGDAALIEYLVQQNATGAPGEEEMEMGLLENALHMKQVRACDCMAPRPEIVHIDVQASIEELRRLFITSSLSRIIVTDGELDKVLGYVHVHQIFGHPRSIRGIVMPITFVPESIQINDLLHKFIKNRTNIACVVDEYGSLAGLVTLEDALEQLFGEIDDEHDQEEFIEVRVDTGEYLLSGRLDVDYINEKFPELAFPSGDYNTLSGYIINATQTIPEKGARIVLENKTFVFELVSDRKIETVRVFLEGRI